MERIQTSHQVPTDPHMAQMSNSTIIQQIIIRLENRSILLNLNGGNLELLKKK
jgi:hypothetical protein